MSSADVWIDGASRGNPGAAGFGVFIEQGRDSEELMGFLGTTTNNVAEYAGLLAALSWARENDIDQLKIHSNSPLLVRQIEGGYKVKEPNLEPLLLQAQRLTQGIASVAVEHVLRESNTRADELANRAIDRREPLPSWLTIDSLSI